MTVEPATRVDAELVADVARLVGHLSPGREPPTRAELEELIGAAGTVLLLARAGRRVEGMLTLVIYRVPSGLRARIEDVVVDETARGHGYGRALVEEALRRAEAAGARTVQLTSRPAREAANNLYRRLGLEKRETNTYVWRPG